LRQFLPRTHAALAELSVTIGTKRYASALRRIYPRLENISVDYAVMETATRSTHSSPRVSVIPAKIGWSDIGSWAAVYELLAARSGADSNVSAGPSFTLAASGNYLWSPKKFIAAIGVKDLVLVETDDAILLCHRNSSQDVAKIVKHLESQKLPKLL
jgi:mannose-1-phosphate guanylyltransferase